MTPIDIRLTIAAHFRLMKTLCSMMPKIIERLRDAFLEARIITGKAIPPSVLDNQTAVFMEKFSSYRQMTFAPTEAGDLMMALIRQSETHSALNTNIFHCLSLSNRPCGVGDVYYPKRDNVTYESVSVFAFDS